MDGLFGTHSPCRPGQSSTRRPVHGVAFGVGHAGRGIVFWFGPEKLVRSKTRGHIRLCVCHRLVGAGIAAFGVPLVFVLRAAAASAMGFPGSPPLVLPDNQVSEEHGKDGGELSRATDGDPERG